jgi:hypothetical protein
MSIAVKTSLRTARVEPASVVRAMGEGKQVVLLVHVPAENGDGEARLGIDRLEFFLIPDDGARDGIRPEHSSLTEGPSDREGGNVTIRYRAIVTEGMMIIEGTQLRGLSDFHIWTEDSLARRARWDPMDPAFLVTCKVQKLDPPITIPAKDLDAAGEWLTIDADLPAASYESVVEHNDYLKASLDVKKAFAEAQKNPVELPVPEKPTKPAPQKPAPAAG